MNSLVAAVVLIGAMVLALVFMGWFLIGLLAEGHRSSAQRKAVLERIRGRRIL